MTGNISWNRKEQQYKRRIHQVLIKDNDKMRQLASSLDAGSGVFIRGFLRTEIARTKDGKTRPLYYIRPRKLIVNQPNASDFDAVHDESWIYCTGKVSDTDKLFIFSPQ